MKLEKIIKFLLLALAFAPLIRDSSVFFPDSAGKIFTVRLFLTIASVLFLYSFVLIKTRRNEILEKAALFFRNPIVLAYMGLVLAYALSTFLAVDRFTAFWGNLQRGEGLVGSVFFLLLFTLTLLIFRREDWFWFFKLSLLTAGILLFREFGQFFAGVERPGSFIGNPTFLAGYLIFSMFASMFILGEEKSKFWRYYSIVILALSVLGIFITETRGALVGVVLGSIAILLLNIFRGRGIQYKNFNLRKVSMILLCALAVFTFIFFITKESSFWQKIPGLARVATINTEDISTRTRLLSMETSISALKPAENGWKKLLLGWGPNNYILAFGQHYQMEQYRYEIEWLDRAHNIFFDVIVNGGVVALLFYLAIWFFYFKTILRRNFSLENTSLIFFGGALFVHLLFVFDHINTLVPFFFVLAYLVSSSTQEKKEAAPAWKKVSFGFLIILSAFTAFVFVRGDAFSCLQMKKYISYRKNDESALPASSVFTPFTIAQANIRGDFLRTSTQNTELSAESMKLAFGKAEEYIKKMPNDFRFKAAAAGSYTRYGNENKDSAYLQKGEEILREVLNTYPNRPDFLHGLALNLAYQGRLPEAFEILGLLLEQDSEVAENHYYYGAILLMKDEVNSAKALEHFEEVFRLKPTLSRDITEIEEFYVKFLQYFYGRRDRENFTTTAKRLISIKNPQAEVLEKMLGDLEKGTWPRVQFK